MFECGKLKNVDASVITALCEGWDCLGWRDRGKEMWFIHKVCRGMEGVDKPYKNWPQRLS